MKRRYANSGVFLLLFTDLIAFNTIGYIWPHAADAAYIPIVVISNLAWLLASHIAGNYIRNKKTWAGKLIKSTVSGFGLLLFFNWAIYAVARQEPHSRYVIMSLLSFGIYLVLCRLLMIGLHRSFAANKLFQNKIILIGSNETSVHLLQQFDRQGQIFCLDGVFTDENSVASLKKHIKGNIANSINFAIENQVREIYTTLSPQNDERLYEIAEIAERNFIQFKVVPDISHYLSMKPETDQDIELPVLSLTPEPEADMAGQLQKRIFDILFSSFIIIFILSWLVPILAFLIKLESEGPVFFKQMRTGKSGSPFICFKFRSLRMNDEADSRQVTANDSRYTRIGKFMRKTNLDEMPQFLNVLLGDMSVVGSRPHMLKHTQDYARLHKRYMTRHYVKPGVTGWAQVNGYRGEIKVDEQLIKRVDHDIWYMENWNFWLDIRIVLQTLTATFKGDKNAY